MSSIPADHAHRFVAATPALTYDDVLLAPALSHVLPREVSLASSLGRGVNLSIPVLAAAMDTVAEADMAIAMARLGGLAVIHKNLTVDQQAAEVAKVKAASPRFDASAASISPDALRAGASALMRREGQSALPVV